MLNIFQVIARLAARKGRAQVAAMFLGRHRASLAGHGAILPADTHAPWREAQHLVAEQLGDAALQARMQRGEQLSADAADRLLFDDPAPP